MKFFQSAVVVLLAACIGIAQEPFDKKYPPDTPPPDGFRKNRSSYSAVMDVLEGSRPRVTQEQLDQLKEMQLENIWSGLGDYKSNFVRGFTSTQKGVRMVGRALTIRFLPPRPDLRKALDQLAKEGDWDRRFYGRAAEEAQPGDVIVVDLGGEKGDIFFGDITALGIKMRGAAGVLIDGGTRDLDELQSERFEGFPVFARFFDVKGAEWLGSEFNVPIRVGGVTVLPGDIVVAEEEGVLVFPPEMVKPVLERAAERSKIEEHERDRVLEKEYRFRDVYPLHPSLKEEFEKKRK